MQSTLARSASRRAAVACRAQAAQPVKVVLKVPHHVKFGQNVCIAGPTERLGNWAPDSCVLMRWNDGDFWTAELEVPAGTSLEYKYIVKVGDGNDVLEWQPGKNRVLQVPDTARALVVEDDWWQEQPKAVESVDERGEKQALKPEALRPKAKAAAAPTAADKISLATRSVDEPPLVIVAEASLPAVAAAGAPLAPPSPKASSQEEEANRARFMTQVRKRISEAPKPQAAATPAVEEMPVVAVMSVSEDGTSAAALLSGRKSPEAGRKAPEAATESFFTQTTEPAAEPAAPPPRMPSFEEAVPPPPQQPQQQRRAGGIGGWAKGVTRAKSSASTDSVSKRIPNKKPGAK